MLDTRSFEVTSYTSLVSFAGIVILWLTLVTLKSDISSKLTWITRSIEDTRKRWLFLFRARTIVEGRFIKASRLI